MTAAPAPEHAGAGAHSQFGSADSMRTGIRALSSHRDKAIRAALSNVLSSMCPLATGLVDLVHQADRACFLVDSVLLQFLGYTRGGFGEERDARAQQYGYDRDFHRVNAALVNETAEQ